MSLLLQSFIIALGLSVPLFADAETSTRDPKEIMKRVERMSSARDEVVQVDMVLVDSRGRRRKRTSTLYTKQKSHVDDMRLIRFHTPADLAKSGVLTIENSDRDDDQWMYLPAYHTARRIPSANRSDTYMGTDFAYEDIADRKIDEYQYRILKVDPYEGIECLVIESIPYDEKLKKETGYSKTIFWVDSEKSVIWKSVFYDKKGALYKTLISKNLKQYDEKYRFQHLTMHNVQKNHKTIVEFHDRRINTGLSGKIFTVRYLKRGR